MKAEIERYAQSGAYPFHMPGHKRRFADNGLPYALDMTEIDGFDNLHRPQGMIREIECKAAALYHAKRAFLLINGATGGIFAAMKAATKRGDRIIIARNCHTSVYRAAELLGLRADYVIPDPPTGERTYDCCGGVNPFALEMLLQTTKSVRLVVITSPTYEGVCSDIGRIAEICHRHDALLLVDEAHGAHFPFHKDFPPSAMVGGADISVVSLHKTLPALTQTALLLTAHEPLISRLQAALAFFQTSSPSYVLMSSIEACLQYAETAADDFDAYLARLHRFAAAVADMKRLRLLFHDKKESIGNLTDYDASKLVISTRDSGLSGIDLANILRKNYKIEVEMAAVHHVIAMTSVCDTDDGFDRLRDALLEIDGNCIASSDDNGLTIPSEVPERRMYPFEITSARPVRLEDATGCVCAEDIFAYPPGIPLCVKGEVLTDHLLFLIKRLQEIGVNVMFGETSASDSILIAD